MDAPPLSPDEARELEELRRRAYGPGGGLTADSAGAARLEDLERRRAARRVAAASPAPAVTPLRTSAAAPTAAVAVGATDAAPPSPLLARARRHPRVVAGVVAAVLVLLVAAWLTPRLIGMGADLTLGEVPAEVDLADTLSLYGFPEDEFSGGRIEQFEDWGGLTILLATSPEGERCLLVEGESYGLAGVSCVPSDLDPIVDVRVWPGMTEDPFGPSLPEGSVVRFVHHDGRVHVWIRAADARA
jgi:hypothetical protein